MPNTFSLLYLVVSCLYICQSLMHQAEISYAGYQPPADFICFVLFLFCKFYQEWCICIQEQGWEKVCYFVYGKPNSFKYFSEKTFYLHAWKQRAKIWQKESTKHQKFAFQHIWEMIPKFGPCLSITVFAVCTCSGRYLLNSDI